MIRLVLLAGLVLTIAAPASAANCRKGKPCGSSCIAQNKVCRIGAPSGPSFTVPSTSAPADRRPATIRCRWAGAVYVVPEALCTNGGGVVVW